MLAFIALFFPAAIMVVWKRYLFKEDYNNWKAMLIEYIVGVLLINFLVIAIAYVFFGSRGSVVGNINAYNNFAIKYVLLAMVMAGGIPYVAQLLKMQYRQSVEETGENREAGKFCKDENSGENEKIEKSEENENSKEYKKIENTAGAERNEKMWTCGTGWVKSLSTQVNQIAGKFGFQVECEKISMVKPFYGRLCLYLYAVVLFALNLTRCFDNVLWGDEAYSVLRVQNSIPEIWKITALEDTHPPLYYLWLKLFYVIFDTRALHIASLVTYGFLLVVAITWFRKKFGVGSAVLLITLATFLNNAETYIVEVRMYSMAILFVLLSFLSLYEVIRQETWKWCMLFAIFSLGAAYTHYYALFTVAFFYVFLLVEALRGRAKWKKVLFTCIVTVIGYLPWLSAFLAALAKKVIDEFWIGVIPTVKQCVYYLFSGRMEKWMLMLYIVVLVILALSCCVCLKKRTENQRIIVDVHRFAADDFTKWIFAGQIAIAGTIVVGIGASVIIRPVLVLRYLFPATVIAWVTLAACISKIRWGNIIAAILAVAVALSYWPQYISVYSQEKDYETEMQTILEATADMEQDAILATDITHLEWTVLEYYYPENHIYGEEEEKAADGVADIDVLLSGECGDDVWVFWSEELNVSEKTRLKRSGYEVEEIYNGIFAGNYQTYIYHLTD